jgi:hypothetical protein
VTKRVLCFAIVAAIAAPTPAAAAPEPALVRTSAKAVEPLVRCLADAEDRASSPWWFVPRESGGGTFSNMGAANVRQPYFLDIAERGATRQIKLSAGAVERAARLRLLAAIDRCA